MDTIANFRDIYTQLQRNVFTDKPADLGFLKTCANGGYLRVVMDADFPFLRRSGTFSTVAGTRMYTPERGALSLLDIRIPAKYKSLRKVDVRKLDTRNPNYLVTTSYSTPEMWYNEVNAGVLTQPTSASVVTLQNSSATEPVSTTCVVEGIVSGEPDKEVITLPPNSSATLAGSKSFTEIHRISKGNITGGRITATSNGATVTLAVLGPFMKTRLYVQVGLEPIPDAVYTCYYKFIPWLPEMVNDEDVPQIPTDTVPLIVDAAMLVAAENLGDMEVVASREKRYMDKLAKLREKMRTDDDQVPQWQFGSGAAGRPPLQPGDYTGWLARDVFTF